MQSFEVEGVKFGGGELSFLLGPCVVESVDHAMMMASSIKEICGRVERVFVAGSRGRQQRLHPAFLEVGKQGKRGFGDPGIAEPAYERASLRGASHAAL